MNQCKFCKGMLILVGTLDKKPLFRCAGCGATQ